MTLEYEKREGEGPSSAAEILSEMTGRPVEAFEAAEYDHPSLDELKRVSSEEAEE
jgi:hypothetical protein